MESKEHVGLHPLEHEVPINLLSNRSREGGCYMIRDKSASHMPMVCKAKASDVFDFQSSLLLESIIPKLQGAFFKLTLEAPDHPGQEYLIKCNGPLKELTAELFDKSANPPECLFSDIQYYSYNMLEAKSPGPGADPKLKYCMSSDTFGTTSLIAVKDYLYPPPGVLFRVVKFA